MLLKVRAFFAHSLPSLSTSINVIFSFIIIILKCLFFFFGCGYEFISLLVVEMCIRS